MKRLMILCAAVAFAASAMAQAASDSKNVDCGSSVTITATPAAGYHFVKWTKGSEEFTTNPLQVTNIKEAKTYVAHFAANEVDFGTDVTVSPANPEPGQPVTLTATPSDDCQEFVRWSDGNTDNPRTFTYDGTVPFTAEYQIKKYQVNVSADDAAHGSVVITQP